MIRKIESTLDHTMVIEGAGVHLRRVFGYPRQGWLDPFLLLDHFGSDDPMDYIAGFPMHPHRGIETVTYMIEGEVEHQDSLGNKGVIRSGDIQWMTAGGGILHQEMPKPYEGTFNGFQLWVNLPASHKMMEPRYQDIHTDKIPEIEWKGLKIRIAAGKFAGITGPVQDIITQPIFFDISMPAGIEQTIRVDEASTCFTYVFQGSAYFQPKMERQVKAGTLAKMVKGDEVFLGTTDEPARLILVAGRPINEPIEWRGPIVMNTKEQLYQAFEDYHNGTFIKK